MLVDLDELILKCPDPQSRAYIKEAIICYKNGAYRSAIVSTWIAVCFDLIDKIRALAGAGDAEAAKLNEAFEKISAQGDIAGALKFEKDLLDVARDKLEFISPLEYIDLRRLIEDRNRCAHPSQVSGSVAFEPTAELARVHIVNAASYVLMQPPAQGKAALQRLATELTSLAFPKKPGDILRFLSGGPLAKPRASLLRNYVVLVLKTYIAKDTSYEIRSRMGQIISALSTLHPKEAKEILNIEFNRMAIVAADVDLKAITETAEHVEIWPLVNDQAKLRILSFVENLPSNLLDYCEEVIQPEVAAAANIRIGKATADEIIAANWLGLPAAAVTRLLKTIRFSTSWAESNRIAATLRTYASDIEGEHVDLLFLAASKNGEVSQCLELPKLITAICSKGEDRRALVNAAAKKYALPQFAIEPPTY